MKTFNIKVEGRVASFLKREGTIICGNSDYSIKFTFDDEWSAHPTKTARFIWNGAYEDVEFTGDTCKVPVISGAHEVQVGVYVEETELMTTTPAVIPCRGSILILDSTGQPGMVQVYRDQAAASAASAERAVEKVAALYGRTEDEMFKAAASAASAEAAADRAEEAVAVSTASAEAAASSAAASAASAASAEAAAVEVEATRDEVNAFFETRMGYNILDPTNVESGYYDQGKPMASINHLRTKEDILVGDNTAIFTMTNLTSALDSDPQIRYEFFDENGTYLGYKSRNLSSMLSGISVCGEVIANAHHFKMWINSNTGLTFSNLCVSFVALERFEDFTESAVIKEGYTPVEVAKIVDNFETVTGANILNPLNNAAGYYNNDLSYAVTPRHLRTKNPILIDKTAKRLYVNACVEDTLTDSQVVILMYDEASALVASKTCYLKDLIANTVPPMDIPTNAHFMHLWLGGFHYGFTFSNICLSYDELDAFEPYEENAYPKVVKKDIDGINAAIGVMSDSIDPIVNRIANPIIIDDFQSTSGWSASVGSVTADTSNYIFGSQSVNFTGEITKSFSIDAKGKELRVKFKINSLDKNTAVAVIAGTSNWSDYVTWTLLSNYPAAGTQDEHLVENCIVGKWKEYVLPWGAGSYKGDVNAVRNNIQRIRFVVQGSGTASVNLQRLMLQECKEPKGAVSFTFDDGHITNITKAAPILGTRGVAATAYIIPSWIGGGDQLSEEQLESLKFDYGWDIEGHWGEEIGKYTEEELKESYASVRKYIQDRGLGQCNHYAYAGGDYSGMAEKIARNYFKSARTIDSFRLGYIDSTTVLNPYTIVALTAVRDESLASVLEKITKVSQNGGWLLLVFHCIGDGVGGSWCSESAFAQIADHAISCGVPIKTVAEVFGD